MLRWPLGKKAMCLMAVVSFFIASLARAGTQQVSITDPPEARAEYSSPNPPSITSLSEQEILELSQAVQLMKELEDELGLTNQLIESIERDGYYDRAMPEVKEDTEKLLEQIAAELESMLQELKAKETEVPERDAALAGPIVIAKEVSDELAKPLPEERDTAVESFEKKDKYESIRVPPPAPQPAIKIYTEKELDKTRSSVIIEKEQAVIIAVDGLKRFLVTEPSIISASREGDKITVTAVGLGRVFLHFWDAEGMHTIKFTVIQKGYAIYQKAKKIMEAAAKMQPFKARYSFDRYRLNSESLNPTRSYHYTEWFHRLNVTGETPWGMTNSRLQYEGREYGGGAEDLDALTAWSFNLRGKDMELAMGDVGANFSEITMPSTGFQGLRFKNPDKEKINYDIVYGARGNRMWGGEVIGWTTENYFSGIRASVEPADFINFNATAMYSLENEAETAEYLYGTGMDLDFFDDGLKISAEAARSKSEETDLHNHSYRIESTLNFSDYDLTLKGIWRDIGTDFRFVTGTTAPYLGEYGYYFDVNYNPFRYLRLILEHDVFRNRFNPNPTETQRFNYDSRATVGFDIGSNTQFSASLFNKLNEGLSPPVRGRGGYYQLSHTFSKAPYLALPATLYLNYEPNEYKNLSDVTSSYEEQKIKTGIRMGIIRSMYYDLEHGWHYKKMTDSGVYGTLKTLSTGLIYSARLMDTPFFGSFNCRYRKEYGVMFNLPLATGENVLQTEAELKYKPSPDFETYIRTNYQYIRGVLDHNQNRQEMRIYGGGSYLLDTTLSWGVGGSLKGYVFKDSNGNGQMDPGEEGLSGIDVYVNETRSVSTDATGKFEFGRIKGYEVSVMMDTKMLPEGHKPTTPNPQHIRMERDVVTEAMFGVRAVAEIYGRVYNDVNMNEVFDGQDRGAESVLLVVDDGNMAQSLPSGHYRIENVKGGARTLTLDTTTLPVYLIPLQKSKRTVEVKEGKYYEEDFALYALRTIVGVVFVDENENGSIDPGEPGVADIELRANGTAALTGDGGRYFLKKLKGGPQKIEIATDTIPHGYMLADEAVKEVELAVEGEIREDVDFILKKR